MLGKILNNFIKNMTSFMMVILKVGVHLFIIERERTKEGVHVSMWACVGALGRVFVCVCVRERVCVYMCKCRMVGGAGGAVYVYL